MGYRKKATLSLIGGGDNSLSIIIFAGCKKNVQSLELSVTRTWKNVSSTQTVHPN